MPLRRALCLAIALVVLLVTGRARAWQEAHQLGDDVQVRLEPNGSATVRHLLRWRVVHGPLRELDLAGVEPGAVLDPAVPVAAEDGRQLAGHLVRRDDGIVQVTVDDARALMRGTFTFDVGWRVDLAASHGLVRDGATWRLTLSSPIASDGFEGGRTVIDAPAAPAEPRAILADTGAVDDAAVSTLRREPTRDILELVRPHVARGESMTWTVRLDRHALSGLPDPRPRPGAGATRPPEPDRVRAASCAASLVALAVVFTLLVAHKGRVVAASCAARGARTAGLLPLPPAARAVLAGVALAAGVALELLGEPTLAGVLVAVATLAAALRVPIAKPLPRGPGRWLILRPDDAFARGPSRSHWLDPGTSAGRLGALLAVALVVGLAVAARQLTSRGHWLVAIDAVALLPLFLTGRASQLPPSGAHATAPWLGRMFRRLRAIESLRVAPWARVVLDGSAADELRLLVLPRAAMPGVVGIETGLAWTGTPVGWVGTPEVLARVLEGSAAAARLAQTVPHARAVPGRRPDERVVRLLPRGPSRAGTVALVRALADALTDRRVPALAKEWSAAERRVLRPMRSPAEAVPPPRRAVA